MWFQLLFSNFITGGFHFGDPDPSGPAGPEEQDEYARVINIILDVDDTFGSCPTENLDTILLKRLTDGKRNIY